MFSVALLAALVSAQPAAAQYRAEPVSSPAAKLILRDAVWTCRESACVAPEGNSRPAIVCAGLARKVGPLRSFSVAGQPLAADELEKCNSRAK